MKELKIDPELRDLLPPLTDEEYKQLKKNIVENGFDKNFPIMTWKGYIVDGHNRYKICKEHNIDFVYGTLAYKTKEEVMEWMLDIQLGRRNLSPIQRIAIAEKYRSLYEKQAKERQGTRTDLKDNVTPNLVESKKRSDNETNTRLSQVAGVGKETYRMGTKILNSDNEKVKNAVLSGEMSINAGYKELVSKKESNNKENISQLPIVENKNPLKVNTHQQVSEETKQICADLKTERTKEYLDSIWDYKIDIIECMNADFKRYYVSFLSTLNDMENRVTQSELNECIENAEKMVEQMLIAIEAAKKIEIKMEV